MKKTYINPTMNVVKYNFCQQLLAGSAARFDDMGSGEVDLSTETIESTDVVL